jgi:lysophospholipase L1-like esterase
MKYFFLSAILCILVSYAVMAQSKLQVTHDTIRVVNAELVIRNGSKAVQGYLYNTGNGITQFRVPANGKIIQFKVGQSGYPDAGDSIYTDTSLLTLSIKVWRNGFFQYRDSLSGLTTDSSTGRIFFHPALQADERIYIEGLKGVSMIFQVLGTPSFGTNLTVLNAGFFDNGDSTFTLRWATNYNTLVFAPKVIGLGSSTLAGYGLSIANERLGEKIGAWLNVNTTSPNWINLAIAGYTSTNILPTSMGGSLNHNIETALGANPDFIFVSLPSNDPGSNISVAQTMSNFRFLDSMALSQGVIIFWETTQPRTSYDAAKQLQLKQLADSIRTVWPARYVEGFDSVVDHSASTPAVILSQYDQGDGTHLKSAGNQFIANSLFDRWQEYFVPVTGVTSYKVETSVDKQSWTQMDLIPEPSVVKKTYMRTDTVTRYYRVKAYYGNGTSSPYSNIVGGGTNLPTSPTGDKANRILIDLGGDGVTTANASGVMSGAPTPSPDDAGKYWNNWVGLGGALGFNTGATISKLVTVANKPTSIEFRLNGDPIGTFPGAGAHGINFDGFTSNAGDYPAQAVMDNLYVHSSLGTAGVTMTIKGLDKDNHYTMKLWGARIDNGTTGRILEASIDGWVTSKMADTKYTTTMTADTNRAIIFTGITGVNSLTLGLRAASGSTFGHVSVIDITSTDSMRDINPAVELPKTMEVTLPADSVLLATTVTANASAIAGYQWTQLSGPSSSTIVSPTAGATIIRGLTNGIYAYQLNISTTAGDNMLDTVTVTVFPDNGGKKTFRVNFSQHASPAIPGWLNAYGNITTSYISFLDTVTSWTINNVAGTTTYWNPFGGSNASDNLGQSTGNNSGIVPDIALMGYWFNTSLPYTSGTNNVVIGGLNPSKTYTLKLVGSRASNTTAPKKSSWHVNNGPEIIQDVLGKTGSDAMTTVTNVSPDANGRINIGVFSSSNTSADGIFSYLNALILQEN